MTPEEQFMKIENALRHAAELGAQHEERLVRIETETEKNSAAIRDLILVSRTLINSKLDTDEKLRLLADSQRRGQEEFTENFNALLQAQLETEQKLQRWIDRQGHGNA
jgi:hypothetical protein